MHLWAYAQIDLRMTPRSFFLLTPRQFEALASRHEANRRRDRREADHITALMVGQLIAMVANTGFRGFKEPRQPQEFLPVYSESPEAAEQDRKPKRRSPRQFDEAMRRSVEMAIAMHKGRGTPGF